ncbi:methylated-DNA--[protein]-cysteine S-methyltransferase [Endozoicomonas atrinae]|uniref:methylated-DNA--[protein]-cysteine S-methyltransferase n=1 Tax=Endozoicomonas atrinae TaxID=1333660 RepID=UPI003AFF9220
MGADTYCLVKSTPLGRALINSPVGILELSASADGIYSVLLAKDRNEEAGQLKNGNEITGSVKAAIDSHLEQGAKELEAYFRGELMQFTVALDLRGTNFQRQVWQELQQIGYGKSCSYQDIASSISRPKAVRAVGAANGANPVAIIVPCHRVIGKNGKLTGYAYGVEMKQFLLDLEQVNRREAV